MQPQQQTAQALKLHLGRAKSFLNKHDYLKGLVSLCEALKGYIQGQFYGTEKMEMSYRIEEIINMLGSFPELSKFLPDNLKYVRGQEKNLYKEIVAVLQKIAEEIKKDESQAQAEADPELERRRLLEKMQAMLLARDHKGASGSLKKIIESYGDDPQIFVEIAEAHYKAGEYQNAVSYALKALKMDNRQMQAYRVAINACRYQKKYSFSESLYQQALQVFGEHANIYLNLARLYREWDKPEEARQSLSRALELEPENKDALELQQQMEKPA